MEIKQPRAGAPADAVGLEVADRQISALVQRFLPPMPHLLSVPTRTPYLLDFPHENLNTPFEDDEVKHLQYMTFLSNASRGVGVARGNWLEEIPNGRSPWSAGARSSITTPNPLRDSKKPAVKMSIADYKNLKQNGVKPSPRPAASATPETRPDRGHSRHTSAVSAATPMARVLSLENGEVKMNGLNGTLDVGKVQQKVPVKEFDKAAAPHSSGPDTQDKPLATSKEHIEHPREPLTLNDTLSQPASTSDRSHSINESLKHPLPPRPQLSPPLGNPVVKVHKRPLESGGTPPEKRAKIEHSRTPSDSQRPIPRSTPTEAKPSPDTPQQSLPPSQSSSQPKKVSANAKIETKQNSKSDNSEKPLNIPPLLSPLPADLGDSPAPHSSFYTVKKVESHETSAPKTPAKSSKIASDTIVVKTKASKNDALQSSPLTTPPKSSPPFVLPRLLSPDLPDIVEQELLRLQEKSKSANTVEARHEKVRQPGAPGVAQKTVRPKVGHPPKPQKNHGESSKAYDTEKKRLIEKSSLIVKLAYKRRNAKNIERILGIKARPDKEFRRLEAERVARINSSTSAPKAISEDSDSSVDVPLSRISNTKKRSFDFSTSATEPAPKRTKLPDNLDVSKAQKSSSPAFKSPALSGPAPKGLLNTPSRKGDAMKSVAMRRVDSFDGHARTPHATATSTPSSAEKSRLNGNTSSSSFTPNHENEKLKLEERKYTELALKLKREMDRLLQLKTKNPEDKKPIPEVDRKLGLCVGLESIAAYMHAFHLNDRANILRGMRIPHEWDSLLGLWEFVHRQVKMDDVLRALSAQIGAVCREVLERILVDGKERDAKVFERMVTNAKKRDESWREASRDRKALWELGVRESEVIGPWSSVKEVTDLVLDVLNRYARKEKIAWKREAEF